MNGKLPPRPMILALAGMIVLAATAYAQQVLTVKDFHRSSKNYVGSSVELTGLAYNIRQETKVRNGRDVAFTSFNLYETDVKGKKGKYYVYVSIPSDSFKTPPVEGGVSTITGPINWSFQVGRIDDLGP